MNRTVISVPEVAHALMCIQLTEATKEFKTIMTAAGHQVKPQVTVSETPLPSKSWYVHGSIFKTGLPPISAPEESSSLPAITALY